MLIKQLIVIGKDKTMCIGKHFIFICCAKEFAMDILNLLTYVVVYLLVVVVYLVSLKL